MKEDFADKVFDIMELSQKKAGKDNYMKLLILAVAFEASCLMAKDTHKEIPLLEKQAEILRVRESAPILALKMRHLFGNK